MNQPADQSLDPRVNRMFEQGDVPIEPKAQLDQLPTYEVFYQLKEGKPFEHVGIVHAPDEDLAFVFAKEKYSRRGNTCTGMFVLPTEAVFVTDFLLGSDSVYDHLDSQAETEGEEVSYEIFHLKKRGKQHIHKGKVLASSFQSALRRSKEVYFENPCPNVWVAPTASVLFLSADDKMIWNTLHEKKYRDAIAYKAGDKLARFKMEQLAD